MVLSATLVYLSAGCNASPHSVSWGRNGCVLYASDAHVVVCDPHISDFRDNNACAGFQARASLRNHTDIVNCVRWIKNPSGGEREFFSVSTDKTCVIWSTNSSGENAPERLKHEFDVVQYMESKSPLQVACAVYLPDGYPRALLALAGIDGSVSLWMRQDKVGFEIVKTIEFGRGQVLDVDMAVVPGTSSVLLACGSDDGKIHLYGIATHGREVTFAKLAALSGHEDWVRGVEFSQPDSHGLIHLLSASQDCTIRLWTIYGGDQKPDDTEDLWNKVNSHDLSIPGLQTTYRIVYDTLLLGHEGWIYGAHWGPLESVDGKSVQTLRILSSSMDKTVIIWEPQDEFGGIWTDKARMGEVGGNNLGFYGCQSSPDGTCVLAHSFSGSLHMWKFVPGTGSWTSAVVCGGHSGPVNDITWDSRGLYLLSTSQDQTTRLHAPWVVHADTEEWHEIARPQVHGYDLVCLASTGPFSFASGAEEKIVRHFQAPRNFLTNFSEISKINVEKEMHDAPEGAAVPALGLSNKAVMDNEIGQNDNESQRYPTDRYAEKPFQPVKSNWPPPEEDLIQNTLWPETHKLYGHGYEIAALACNHARTVLASASRANHPEHAEIFLWVRQGSSWTLAGKSAAHNLTVTQMEFSHNDQYLLSVSRDRTWALFKQNSEEPPYVLCARPDKKSAQSRIIWSCCWTPDDKYFATGSRDKTVFTYHIRKDSANPDTIVVELLHKISLNEAATGLDAELFFGNSERYLLAVGTDDGHIQLFGFDRAGLEEPSVVTSLPISHHKTVNRLRFQPSLEANSAVMMKLASCGIDRAVKIFKLTKP